ncbi:P-loop NTPase fold protein [Nostoc sp. GT001]|uniref:P-loop NTPase fold protein n=1 Tax=Nostoc sp. GT001 TaxID=3056647 RepID=UPI0025AA3DF6|nr:P-loop NTPase fold protein [Nostoc sp. GT001]MDM9581167.1 hypothetical protein [Nostoc sp. GT001]
MNSSSSAITDITNAIASQNPFDRPLVVRSQDVWGKGFPDVPSLNAQVSDTIFEAIEKVRLGQRHIFGVTITAEKGLGKSHLISRIRHRLQADGTALFVYMSECADLNRIKTEFLRNLANSLKQIGSQGVSQWRELATALINEAFNKNHTPQQLVNQFPGALAKNPRVVDILRDKILSIKPDIENPDILTAIIWTLSPDSGHESFAINWLSGRNLPQSKADEMGLANPSNQDKEAESFTTIRQILDLIGRYKPIVICFDELDVPECNEAGFTKAQVVAGIAKDLYNSIKSGVLLTAMYAETWVHQVKVLSYAEAVVDRIGEKVLELKYLNSDDVVTLVATWLKDFYDEKGLTPPHLVYPFDEDKLRELGKERPIVRRVLKWCAENFKVTTEPQPLIPPKNPVESAYIKELEGLASTIQDYMDDKVVLADSLWLGFSALIGETIEKFKIEDITEITAKAADKGYLDFKIVGKENGKTIKIGVAVLQESGGMFVQATLKRLIDYKKFDLTRGCLVRSKQVNKGAAKAQEYLSQLLSPKLGGEWVLLKSEDIKPLLAILLVFYAREDYEFSEEEILDFIYEHKIAVDNYLIREILSDPSGQVPQDAINEETEGSNVTRSEITNTINVDTNDLFPG